MKTAAVGSSSFAAFAHESSMVNNDERKGLPSASSMSRLKECSGSLAFIAALKASNKYFELTNRDATSGTKIHWYLAVTPLWQNENLDAEKELTGYEMGTARSCRELQRTHVHNWIGTDDSELEFIVERRFWYRTGLKRRFSGQPDFIVMTRSRALILNFKTGRIEADNASDNVQLRTEIVLLKHEYPELREIDAAIIEPHVSWERERVHYELDALEQAENEILAIVDEASWNLKRTPGPHCKFCPARVNCPEATNYVQTALDYSQVHNLIRELPRGVEGSRLWEKIALAEKLLDDMRKTYKSIMTREPDALPGYVLPSVGYERRKVVNAQIFKEALREFLPPQVIDAHADYPISIIEEMYGVASGLKGKKLEQEFARLTANSVELSNAEPFIRPLTKKEKETAKIER
jgi:hypothetical protein